MGSLNLNVIIVPGWTDPSRPVKWSSVDQLVICSSLSHVFRTSCLVFLVNKTLEIFKKAPHEQRDMVTMVKASCRLAVHTRAQKQMWPGQIAKRNVTSQNISLVCETILRIITPPCSIYTLDRSDGGGPVWTSYLGPP